MASGERSAARSEAEAPDPYRPDLQGLRSFLEALVAAGSLANLVSWLVTFIATLWKIQQDLQETVRAHKRSKPPSERLSTLLWLPGFEPAQPANDNKSSLQPRPPKKDRRRRGNNPNRDPHGRTKLPPELPRKEQRLYVPEDQRCCPRCAREMSLVEWEPSEQLDREPAEYFVVRWLRERLRCGACQGETITAPAADQLKDKGVLAVDLVVDATVDHYLNAVPFERMAREARAQGVPLSANTLGASVGALVDLLDPIVKHIFHACLRSEVVAVDATSMPVLDPELRPAIRSAALWCFVGDASWSYFGYASSGHAERLKELLKGYELPLLQCDGSPTINVLERRARARGGCHAHARRKLVEAVRAGDVRAVEALLWYAELFAIEAQSKALGEDAAQRQLRRAQQSALIWARLQQWVQQLQGQVEPRSPLGQALKYLVNQRARLELFLHEGRLELTNNRVERELRTYVLDRKTWLFNGHEESAKRTAAALTVLRTCRLLKVDARSYLRTVVRKLLAGETDAKVLWPEHYVPSSAAAA